eukprot:10658279-Prorocentrum_lima.AAC.1
MGLRFRYEDLGYDEYDLDQYIRRNNFFEDHMITGILKLIRDVILRKQFSWNRRESRFERTLNAWFLNIWPGDPYYETPGQRLNLRKNDDNACFDALAMAD